MHYPTYIENALVTLEFTTMPPKNLQELNKKYHMLALKYHPDKTGGDETIFSNIREDVENKHLLFFIKYTRESFIDYYKDDVDTWTFIVKSHIEKWKKIVYAMT
jgi:hypothetical protein